MNDVYHNISLGVPDRYRAQSGVTITANASCGIIRRHCLQTTIYRDAAQSGSVYSDGSTGNRLLFKNVGNKKASLGADKSPIKNPFLEIAS